MEPSGDDYVGPPVNKVSRILDDVVGGQIILSNAEHRRWMLRVFAVGVGVGSIRIVIGLTEAFGIGSFRVVFGPAFWIAFTLHVMIMELKLAYEVGHLRRRPAPT